MPRGYFEIGGGNGVLGAMLHEEGYQYISTDITQAFYLEQNNLWEGLYPNSVYEYMEDGQIKKGEQITHIPWWRLWDLRDSDLEADIMVSNHNLAEMHPRALSFYLKWGRHMMRNSKYQLLVAQSSGSPLIRSFESLMNTIYESGYVLLYSARDFMVFSVAEKENIKPATLQHVIGDISQRSSLPIYISNEDELSRKLNQGLRQNIPYDKLLGHEEIKGHIQKEFPVYDTPDEEFIHYIGKDSI